MLASARPWLEHTLLNAWSRRGATAALLWPLSKVFHGLAWVRRSLFRHGVLPIHHVDAYVVVVGNVVAGGAGKTPTVIAVAKHLTASGQKVGVISRGYGRHIDTCAEVLNSSTPHDVGDEPLLIHRTTQLPVFVCRNRVQAAQALLARHPQTQVIVCDDGLQHYGLYRDLEICVFDNRGCGNGWLLPAGPLREPWPRQALTQAGQRNDRLLVLHTGNQPAFAGYQAHRSLSTRGLRSDGSTIDLVSLLVPGNLPIMAVAGIAQPNNFFSMLQAMDIPLANTLALPDHYDFDSLPRSVLEGYTLLCTEKDALKLWNKMPAAIAIPLVQTAEPGFYTQLDLCMSAATVPATTPTTLSSPHGHQTS